MLFFIPHASLYMQVLLMGSLVSDHHPWGKVLITSHKLKTLINRKGHEWKISKYLEIESMKERIAFVVILFFVTNMYTSWNSRWEENLPVPLMMNFETLPSHSFFALFAFVFFSNGRNTLLFSLVLCFSLLISMCVPFLALFGPFASSLACQEMHFKV